MIVCSQGSSGDNDIHVHVFMCSVSTFSTANQRSMDFRCMDMRIRDWIKVGKPHEIFYMEVQRYKLKDIQAEIFTTKPIYLQKF